MSLTETKSIKVTFNDGLPLGVRGSFKRDGQWWIAIPLRRWTTAGALIDRLLGLHAGIINEMVRWINNRPQDAELVTLVIERSSKARTIHRKLLQDKAKARTQ